MKHNILALDVGDKRVGTAIVDSSTKRAIPFRTFTRAKYTAEQAIIETISQKEINLLVVGLPLDAQLRPTTQAEKIQNFCRRLLKRIDIKLIYVDEILSSEEAKERLKLSSKKKAMTARKSGAIDSMSAAVILQRYLDNVSNLKLYSTS